MVFTCGYGVRRTNTGSKGLLKQGPTAASQRAMARVIAKCKGWKRQTLWFSYKVVRCSQARSEARSRSQVNCLFAERWQELGEGRTE